jgi:flagellar biogenesis protein FliO
VNSPADSLGLLTGLDTAATASSSLTALALRSLMLLLLLVSAIFLVRHFLGKRLTATASSRPMEVLNALSLGPRRQVMLLRVSGRVLLVGAGEGGLRTLARFDGEEAGELLKSLGRNPSSFGSQFKVALDKGPDDNA